MILYGLCMIYRHLLTTDDTPDYEKLFECVAGYGLGGSAIAMVPIDSKPGDVQSWECEVPVQVPARVAGTSLSHITVFLSNEDGEKLNLMGDRWSAQLILSF